jgi:hypothetical protein
VKLAAWPNAKFAHLPFICKGFASGFATLADEGQMGSESIEPSGRKNVFGEYWRLKKKLMKSLKGLSSLWGPLHSSIGVFVFSFRQIYV